MSDNPTPPFNESLSTNEDGFDVGATPKLTTTLKRLVRAYPKDIGIIKEFIQNADDAGARCVKIIMDWRSHPFTKLPDPKMQVLMGPALLIFNDAIFRDEDLKSIQNIGESVKQLDTSKIGRFGLGFNATYNVTDYPSLLTRNYVLFFDPHLNVIGVNSEKPGRGWNLQKEYKGKKVWDAYPDMLSPFRILDSSFISGQDYFEGTLFRLPLRTELTKEQSQIKQEAFSIEDFTFLLDQLKRSGAELLLFLKNVIEITVSEIQPDKNFPDTLLTITTENESAVLEERRKVNTTISENSEKLIDKIRSGDRNLPKISYIHRIHVNYLGCTEIQEWRLAAGLFSDDHNEILQITQEMISQKEKAFPWAGCAARIKIERNGLIVDPKINGEAYCLLPLGMETGLPVHINGMFDLDESRKLLTSGELRGGDEKRVTWNKLLVKHCVARAYAGLLTYLVKDIGAENIAKFYSYWPDPDMKLPAALNELTVTVYRRLQESRLLASAADDKWKNIRELVFFSKPDDTLFDALMAEKIPLPSPHLPTWIFNGFRQSGISLQFISPKWIRDRYRVAQDTQCNLSDALKSSLRKREWVEAILRYCLSDNQSKDLKGLPLAILCDGKLHTFGYFNSVAFLANDTERKIFADEPNWFIDPSFARNCGLISSIPEVGLMIMSAEYVIDNLQVVIKPDLDAIEWQPQESKWPNEEWLILLFRYLVDNKWEIVKADKLKDIPLIPDQFSKLWKMGKYSTPLLITTDNDIDLLHALKIIEIPLVTGSRELLTAIESFYQKFQGFIWQITGPDLVDLLDWSLKNWGEKARVFDKNIHEPLLDFLADNRHYEDYKLSNRIEKIKKLPILITETTEIICPNKENIYIPAGENPPPIAGEIKLIQTGQHDQWREFIRLLGIQELKLPVLIQRIIDSYNQLTNSKKVEAFRWIRKNIDIAEEQVEKETSRSAAESLRKLVAESPLVICQGNKLAPIVGIYDPRIKIIKNVLGDNADFPDLETYKQGERLWLEFFEKLGMAKSPRANDLLKYIDSLISESNEFGSDAVVKRILAVYDHIRDNWEELAIQEVQDGTITQTMQSALYKRAWLPARRSHDTLAQFPGYKIPQDRLYNSSELHMPRSGHLIASQCSVAAITQEPPAKIREGLGFPEQPVPENVVQHFKELLKLWNSSDHSSIKESDLEISLRSIYEFIGDHFKNTPFTQKLLQDFQDVSCIWDFADKLKSGKKFWKPCHTFKEAVPYLSPYRIRIAQRSDREGRGFDAFGRKESPELIDYFELLFEILFTCDGKTADTNTAETVIYALDQIAVDLSDEDEEIPEIPVLTKNGFIVKACDAFEFDAPWWEGKINSNLLHIIDIRVHQKIREHSNIRHLSEYVIEKPLEMPDPVIIPEIVEQCLIWQHTIRSIEFQQGLKRLIKHNYPHRHFEDPIILNQLASSIITPVEKIKTQLTLIESGNIVGTNESDCFYDEGTRTFFVVAKNEDDLDIIVEFLAQSLNNQLEGLILSDLSPLVRMIDLMPGKIDSTLTRLRIRQLSYEKATYSSIPEEEPESETEENSETESEIQDQEQKTIDSAEKMVDGSTQALDEPQKETQVSSSIQQPPIDGITADAPESRMRKNRRQKMPGQAYSSSQSQGAASGRDYQSRGKYEIEAISASPIASTQEESTAKGRDHFSNTHSPGSETTKSDIGKSRGKARGANRSRKTRLTISRVFSAKHQETLKSFDTSDDEIPQNIEIGKAAVARVLKFEAKEGCETEEMTHNNRGYDVISIPPNANKTKYIEVKGIDGPWTEDGVPVSPAQFTFGQKREESPDEEFWLYVVEYARDDNRFNVYPILNPTGQVTQFRFDSGWKELAANYKKPLEPAVGRKIKLDDGIIGTITQIMGERMLEMEILLDDGNKLVRKYRKSRMEILPNGE